jgi:hypothetical protein
MLSNTCTETYMYMHRAHYYDSLQTKLYHAYIGNITYSSYGQIMFACI